jgi:hypothetical protein
MKVMVAALACVIAGTAIVVQASDRIGVYAVVDRVVFEPNDQNPERIQIWGAFAVATRNDRDNYDAVQRGYLYFTADRSDAMTRAEWNDLKSVAGTKRIVGFSSRFGQTVRVRAGTDKPATPDTYVTGVGVNAVRSNSDYAPIKALASQISR